MHYSTEFPSPLMRTLFLGAMAGAVAIACHAGERENVRDLAHKYGFPQPAFGRSNIVFASGCSTMTFEINSRKVLFNGLLLWLNDSLSGSGNNWTLNKADVVKILDPLMRPDTAALLASTPVIVIDPGHGGMDTGAGDRRLPESKLTLDIAKRVVERLRSSGLHTKLTRDNDVAMELQDRTKAASKANASIFVSIHMNSAANTYASGIETYALPAAGFASTSGGNGVNLEAGNRNDAANTLLAYSIQRSILERTGSVDRGIKRARFDVLCQAPCPAVLVECGFLSNPFEETMLSTRDYRQTIADAIADGILAYVGMFRSNR